MITAALDKQLMITVDNKVGTLAEVTRVIASAGINLVAACAYAMDNKGFIIFVTEDNDSALKLLEEKGYNVRVEEVVLASLGNQPGALQMISEKIADAGVDLTLIYGSVEKGNKTSRIVMVAEDNRTLLTIVRMMQ